MSDNWYYSDIVFKTGRSYALVSEYQQGCMYLSYLLGGQIEIKDGLEIYLDDMERSHPDATVYLIKSNYYTHRHHTEAVLVDGNYFFFTDY